MQNVYHKIQPFLPHSWVGMRTLKYFFLVLFYLVFAVGLYAAYELVTSFFVSTQPLAANALPLRQIFAQAMLQAFLAGVALLSLVHLFDAFYAVGQKATNHKK